MPWSLSWAPSPLSEDTILSRTKGQRAVPGWDTGMVPRLADRLAPGSLPHEETLGGWRLELCVCPFPPPRSPAQVCFSWHPRVNRCEQVYRDLHARAGTAMAFTHKRWQLPPSAGRPSKHIVAWHLRRLQPTCERAPCHPSRWAEGWGTANAAPSWRW